MEKNTYKNIDDSQISISQLMLPSHSNFNGKIHGGFILSLLDQIAFACASKHSGEYCVTASVDTVDFLKPVEIGELVTMKASINFVGKSSMVVGVRVEAQNIQTGKVKHCNSSYFTLVAKNNHGKNMEVPGLILKSDEDIRRFVQSLQRLKNKKTHQREFAEIDFSSEKYMHLLDDYRVKLERE
ncbi:MAG TPA: acyl-CoA thioesterase [Flavobacteriaceae bacterium]|nr:acyl-CoA thioesterase [Flavobacteriaceae bacterium]